MTAGPDGVDEFDGEPRIVHISDVHGYLDDARSALHAVGETDRFDPVVTADDAGRLHWADNDYVLVVNGDLIDRGPANEACLDMVWRLQREAPSGRVRYHLGNHELAVLLPTFVRWPGAYSTSLDAEDRRGFLERVREGNVSAAFEGYDHTYSHAGRNDSIATAEVNATVRSAAADLLEAGGDDEAVQRRLEREHDHVFGIGSGGGRGPDAGLCWMDFTHLDASAPPQVVGHTKRAEPVRKGNVVCGNVIRTNHHSPGGEGVLVEGPDGLIAVTRRADGSVSTASV